MNEIMDLTISKTREVNHEVEPTEETEIEAREAVNHKVGHQQEQNELTTGEREELAKIGEWEKEMEREEGRRGKRKDKRNEGGYRRGGVN